MSVAAKLIRLAVSGLMLGSAGGSKPNFCLDSQHRKIKHPVYSADEVKVLSKIHTKDRVVFITIDDGVTVSDELAKFIDEKQLPITTFALAGELWRNRDWFMQRSNMTFENHTNTHAHMTLIKPEQQIFEICRASQVIRNVTAERPVFFRPQEVVGMKRFANLWVAAALNTYCCGMSKFIEDQRQCLVEKLSVPET